MLLVSGIFLILTSLSQPPLHYASESDTLISTLLPSFHVSYTGASHCASPANNMAFLRVCDNSTNGTGHQLYESLSKDVVSVERCYSFCFSNVRNRQDAALHPRISL